MAGWGAMNAFMFINANGKGNWNFFFTVKENEMQYFYAVFHKTNLSSRPEQEASLKQRE